MASQRITIFHEADISPLQAMLAAGHAIDFWTRETAAGNYWSPGAIATYKNSDTGETAISTSTRKTRAGWSIILYRQTLPEELSNATAS